MTSKKDPNGLMKNDLLYLRRVFKPRPITPDVTMSEIQFEAGKQFVIDFIERDMVDKR